MDNKFVEFFHSLSEQDQLEILQSLAQHTNIGLTQTISMLEILKQDQRQEKLFTIIKDMNPDVKDKLLESIRDEYLNTKIDKFDCYNSRYKINADQDRVEGYKDIVDTILNFCTITVPQTNKSQKMSNIKECSDQYKKKLSDKCNFLPYDEVLVRYEMYGFITKVIKYDSPFIPSQITLKSSNGAPISSNSPFVMHVQYMKNNSIIGEFEVNGTLDEDEIGDYEPYLDMSFTTNDATPMQIQLDDASLHILDYAVLNVVVHSRERFAESLGSRLNITALPCKTIIEMMPHFQFSEITISIGLIDWIRYYISVKNSSSFL